MRNKALWGLLALLLIILPLGLIAYGQDDADQPANPTLKITGINTATLPEAMITVNVVDAFGQYVPNLTVEDFNLTNELSQYARIVRVENVTDDDLPISVVLVIDTSSSMQGSPIARARQAAVQFVDQLGEQDSVAIITFDSEINTVQDFTTDKALLRHTIETFSVGGTTALYDGTAVGLIHALTSPTDRRTVVLLSDGAEYGWTAEDGTIHPASDVSRAEILRTVSTENAPIYTIGLGFGADRSYLQEVASSTNGQFYESPTPDSLTEIYSQIASILRTQYILTLNADLPLDGGEYDFSLQARTPYALTNIDSARLRAPIPVPLIDLSDLPTDEITQETALPIRILADDYPLDVQFSVLQAPDGVVENLPLALTGEGETYALNIDPRQLTYGAYQAEVVVTDGDGDQSSGLIDFTIGSIPTEFDVTGLPTDHQLAGIFTPDQVLQLGVVVDYSQAPITRVIYEKDGVVLGESTEAPFTINIPVLETFMGQIEHNLTVVVQTQDRQDVLNIPLTSAVSPPPTPTFTPTFTPSPTATPTPTPTADMPATLQAHSGSINSALGSLQSHSATQSAYVQETYVAQSTADAQATFQAQSTIDAQARLDARATSNAESTLVAQSTADAQSTLNFEATTVAEQTLTFEATLSAELEQTAIFEANISATETHVAQSTADAVNTSDAQLLLHTIATLDAQETATAQAMLSTAQAIQTEAVERVIQVTANAQATIDSVNEFFGQQTATQEAQSTLNVELTADAVQTLESQSTLDVQQTADAVQTLDAESTVIGLTLEAQATTDGLNAVLTLDAESTVVGLTLEAQATADYESTAIGGTIVAQSAIDVQATETADAVTATPTPTLTPEFTNTPVVLIEVDTPTAGTNFLTQVQPYLAYICAGGLALLLLLFLLFRRNKSN